MGYLRNRLLQAGLTIYIGVTLSFLLIRLMPGGPIQRLRAELRENPQIMGNDVSEEQIDQFIQAYINIHPDRPIWQEYIDYTTSVLTGDLGRSIWYELGTPVTQIYAEAIPWTVFISSIGMLYGLIVGILLGSLMAYYESSRFDVGATIAMILNGAIPYYVAAIFLLFIFGFQLELFPSGGRYDPDTTPGFNPEFVLSVLAHAALPVASMIIVGFGGSALGMRANSMRILGDDYIRVAHLRGLSTYRISTRYIARNAVLPLYTMVMIGLGFIIGGSIILEEIFSYPGVGYVMYYGTLQRDYPVMMGGLLIMIVMFVIAMLVADLTYSKIDPRADQSGAEAR